MTSTSSRKLVLHFDAQNTLTALDSSRKLGIAHALNAFLCGMVWGTIDSSGSWERISDTLSITRPEAGAVSYYKYLEPKLVTSSSSRREFLDATRNITVTNESYSRLVGECLDALRWNVVDHENDTQMDNPCIAYEDSLPYHLVFPSFVKLIQKLYDSGRDFSVVIRSFGDDTIRVLKALEHALQTSHAHPLIKEPLGIKVTTTLGRIRRKGTHDVEINYPDHSHMATSMNTEREIYDKFSTFPGIWGLKDDYVFWREHSYVPAAGKPFWINAADEQTHHIFLDDNLRLWAEDSIVDFRCFSNSNPLNEPDIVDALQQSCSIQVDMLAAILDVDYYIDKVEQCENKHSRLEERL